MGQSFRTEISFYECVLYIRKFTILPNDIHHIIIDLLKLIYMNNISCNYDNINEILALNMFILRSDINEDIDDESIKCYQLVEIFNPYKFGDIHIILTDNKLVISRRNIFHEYNDINTMIINACENENYFVYDMSNFIMYNGKIVTDITKLEDKFLSILGFIFCYYIVPIQTIDINGYRRLVSINTTPIFSLGSYKIKYLV